VAPHRPAAAEAGPDFMSMNKHPRGARSGFTLLELLMVITIIALLAGMVLPVTGDITARAQSTKCMANLRQIGMAAHSAATDNDNRFPLVEIDVQNSAFAPEDNALPLSQVFKKYGITEPVLQCAADLKGPNWFAKTGASYMWQPYAEDEPTAAISIYTRRGQYPGRQSRVRLATDFEAVHPGDKGGRKKANTLYADGHVKLR
jgi:prepilin-type N-terminal cleavage/methylation domain-containing protein/prepilin-type processing-associated H-X9-DG protein